jgi:predicted AAA+ superfamily ATPase
MILNRELTKTVKERLIPGQVVMLYGPRRSGKTTFVTEIFDKLEGSKLFINAEDPLDRISIHSDDLAQTVKVLADFEYLFIDEAQIIDNIGKKLKYIADILPALKILVTGSASFDLINKVGEPLTGRKVTLKMYPFAYEELNTSKLADISIVNEGLVYGSYPALYSLSSRDQKIEYLYEIVESYLLRDILEYEDVRNSRKIKDLLSLLAFQVGSMVSLTELGNQLDLHKDTVLRYLDILEKVFIIYRVGGFSRNLRKEVTKTAKYYFVDNGIRNALISNFNPLSLRDDQGKLWENYIMSERMKYLDNHRRFVNRYFWRTYDQKEIDLIEDSDGKLKAYEFKYSSGDKVKVPNEFIGNYPDSSFDVITPNNIYGFITQ